MNKFKTIMVFMVLVATISSCTKAIIDEGETNPIDEIIKFDPDVQNITFNYCVTCHGGSAPSAGVDLTSYDNVRFYTESGSLLERINDASSPMPPSGLISEEDRQIIDKWVQDGFLEN